MSQVLLIPGIGRMTFAGALRLLQPYSPRLAANFMDPAGSLYTDASRTTQVTTLGNRIRSFTNFVTGQPHGAATSDAKSPLFARRPATGRRNLLTYTEAIDDSVWTKNAATIVPNATTAPNGTLTADKLVANNTIGLSSVSAVQSVTKAASVIQYTYSLYAKALDFDRLQIACDSGAFGNRATATYSLIDGSVVSAATTSGTFSGASATISDELDGWYLVTLTFTTGTETTVRPYVQFRNSGSETGDGVKGSFAWGMQLEVGTKTNYQRVVTSADITEAGVRDVYSALFDGSDDCLQVSGFDLSNTNKATVIAFGRKQIGGGCIVELSSISTNNRALTLTCSDIAGSEFFWATGGTGGGTGDRAVITTSVGAGVFPFCAAGCYDRTQLTAATQIKTFLNGSTPTLVTQQNGTLAGNFLNDTLNIGGRGNAITLALNGSISALFICGEIVPDAIITKVFRGLGPQIGVSV